MQKCIGCIYLLHTFHVLISNGQLSNLIKSLSIAIFALLLYFHQLNNLLTPWGRIFLQNLIFQAIKNMFRALWNTQVYFRFQNPVFCPYPESDQTSPRQPSQLLEESFQPYSPIQAKSSIRPLSVRCPYAPFLPTYVFHAVHRFHYS